MWQSEKYTKEREIKCKADEKIRQSWKKSSIFGGKSHWQYECAIIVAVFSGFVPTLLARVGS